MRRIGIGAALATGTIAAGLLASPATAAVDRLRLNIPIQAGETTIGHMRGLMVSGRTDPAPISLTLRGSARIRGRTCLVTTVFPARGGRIVRSRSYLAGDKPRRVVFAPFGPRSIGRLTITHDVRVLARMSVHRGSCRNRAYARALVTIGGLG